MSHHRALALLGLLLVAAVVPSAKARPREDVTGAAVAAALRAKAAREGRVRIIAEMAPAPRTAPGDPSSAKVPDAAALGHGARPLGSLPFAALEVDAQELEKLLASGAVIRVGENRKVRPSLRQSVRLIGGTTVWKRGARGRGQNVVVIDTGVRSSHPFLAGRVVRSLCSAVDCGARVVDRPGAGEPYRGCPRGSEVTDHGTHVAGIAAGRGSAFSGVAPDAGIISIRVFRCEAADWEYVIRALDYVATKLASKHRIAAVNLSLNDDAVHYRAACDRADATSAAISAVVGKLRRLGIATVAASGNEWRKNGISPPACIDQVIAVGSTNKDDTISWFSNSAPNLDLLAPGSEIYSSLATGRFGVMDGTSMAAPHVAGAIAAIRSKLRGASMTRIERALKATGRPVLDRESRVTRPRINVARALARLTAARVAAVDGAGSTARGYLESEP